jgi:hypothetical protein
MDLAARNGKGRHNPVKRRLAETAAPDEPRGITGLV